MKREPRVEIACSWPQKNNYAAARRCVEAVERQLERFDFAAAPLKLKHKCHKASLQAAQAQNADELRFDHPR